MRGKGRAMVDVGREDFGMMLNWAVRYSVGRMTYAPGETIRFILPLLPHLSDKALRCFDRDIENRKREGGSFGMDFDEKEWMLFWERVKEEIGRRGK